MKTLILHLLALIFVSSCNKSTTINNNGSFKTGNQIVIAHRGASAFLPEHTLEAYAYAYAAGADFIEPDVVLTKDSVPICLHDTTLEKTTNIEQIFPERKRDDGHWYAIDFTLAEIKKLNVHERTHQDEAVFPTRFPLGHSSFQIPTFEEFIQLIQGLNTSTGKNVGIYPEIKKPEFHQNHGKNSAIIILDILQRYGYENKTHQIFLQSFDPTTLKKLKTDIPLIQLIGENSWGDSSTDFNFLKTNEGLKKIKTYAKGIGIWLGHIKQDSTLIERAKKQGLLIHAYTHRVEKSENSLNFYFKELKINGIFSDQPSL